MESFKALDDCYYCTTRMRAFSSQYPWFRLCKYDCYVILLYIVLIFNVDGIFLAWLWP
jgi:hypothetical protein